MSGISTTLSLDGSPFFASLKGIEAKLGQFRNTFSALTASFTGMLAIGPAISNAFGGITSAIDKAGTMESMLASFEVLLGDAEGAKRLMEELIALGAATPFEMSDLAPAAKSLIAFGVAANEVTGTLRRVGDISSGIGAPIGEIAEIYGKARVQGRLFAQDVNQLTGRGIPVIQEFARQFGVTDGAVRKLVEDGQIGFRNLEQAFVSLTSEGGKFNGMMAKQSQTWGGLVSTLKDGISQLMVAFGQPVIAALKPQITALIASLGGFDGAARTAGAALGTVLGAFTDGARVFGSMISGLASIAQALPVVGDNLGKMVLGFVVLKTVVPLAIRVIRAEIEALGIAMIKSGGMVGVLGNVWKATWAGMAVAMRSAILVMKSALVSTGIGAIVVALGEGVAWAYRKISSLTSRGSGKAIDAQSAADLQKFTERVGALDSEESKQRMAEEVGAEISSAETEAQAAAEAGDPRAAALQRRVEMLKKVAQSIREVPDALLEENAASKQSVELIKDETKQREERRKAIDKELEQYEKSKKKAALAALPLDEQLKSVQNSFNGLMPDGTIYERGGLDLAGIEKEMARLKGSSDLGDLAYLEKLIEGAETLLDINQKRAELAKKAAAEEAEHVNKVAQLRAELAGHDEKLRKLRSEQKIRERIKELTDLGIKDAKKKAEEEVGLEDSIDAKKRRKTLEEFASKFRRDMTRMDAELRGDKATVTRMDREQKIEDFAKEAREAGVTDPNLARQLATQKADAEIAAQRKISSVADSDRRVGLGGRAFGGSTDPLVKAQQAATKATRDNTTAIARLNAMLGQKPQIVREIVGPVFK